MFYHNKDIASSILLCTKYETSYLISPSKRQRGDLFTSHHHSRRTHHGQPAILPAQQQRQHQHQQQRLTLDAVFSFGSLARTFPARQGVGVATSTAIIVSAHPNVGLCAVGSLGQLGGALISATRFLASDTFLLSPSAASR